MQINKLFNWYFTKKALPYWCVLLCDCCIVVFSLLFVHAVNVGVIATVDNILPLLGALACFLLFYLVGFRVFHTYDAVVRYSSFVDLMKVSGSVMIGGVLSEIVRLVFSRNAIINSISGLDILYGSLIAILLMWFVRAVVKLGFDAKRDAENIQNVLIFGSKEGGVSIAKSIRSQQESPYAIKGFITQYPDMVGHTLFDLPILGVTDPDIWEFIESKDIEAFLVSPLAQDYFVTCCQPMIDKLIHNGIKIKMMPVEQEWDGKSDISHLSLREVSVEDLLPRKKIEVDMLAIGQMLKGQRILITGAAGSIGSEMVRQVAKFEPEEMILIDQAETPMHDIRMMMDGKYPQIKAFTIVASIGNQTHMEKIFAEHKPQYVFHAAAYKHVPMMEDNPAMAVQNNIYGTRVIADLAVKYGARKFVMISTDKAVNPTNVMGCSKRICEIYCQALNAHQNTTQFVTTRFGNVLGSNGSVIPIFADQIRKGGPVTVTHPDIIRFFMLIPEACRLVLEAGTMGKGGEIFVFDMGEPVRIADLAQRMIDMMGAKDVKIVYTGLRDGEKLYEEVLSQGENDKPTVHPKIKVAAVREYPYEDALRNEEELYKLSFSYDDMAIVAKMKEIVPEYKSQQSKYEELDK